MKYRLNLSKEEEGIPILSGVLVVGLLVHFTVDPGGVLENIANVVVPTGVMIGLLFFAVWLRFRTHDVNDVSRIARFGWIGAIGTGSVAILLIGVHVALNSPVSRISDDVVTVVSIGIGTGVLVGTSKTGDDSQSPVPDEDVVLAEGPELPIERPAVLAEVTWTSRQDPNPIVVTIVEAIAEIEGCDPLELEPFSAQFDPDTFELIRRKPQSQWQVLFQALEYEILVSSCGTVLVYENARGEKQYLNELVGR